MGRYTKNKPKALVSVEGLPMLLNVFRTFEGSFFIVIGDYKYEVLRDYLLVFGSKFKYTLVKASGTGTCAGLRDALRYVPEGEPFILTWSDLYFTDNFRPNFDVGKNYVGISKNFRCRWSYVNGEFVEEPSFENGVAGFFVFADKATISDVPDSGEFVRYLSEKEIPFERFELDGVREFGTAQEYEDMLLSKGVSRPFNTVVFHDDYVEKTPVDAKGRELAVLEVNWYRFVSERGYASVPRVISLEPLRLERIDGGHPFEIDPDFRNVEKIISALENLHHLAPAVPANILSLDKEYFTKTFERLNQVLPLIPHADKREITINGVSCPNPYFLKNEILDELREHYPATFGVIHGDPTFSNTLISKDGKVCFIDPRGYFGYTQIYGDVDYDFAKLYYSLVGNYDKFNRKKFDLSINENDVELTIESSGYEKFEDGFFDTIGRSKIEKVKLLHAIIWLSLTTYAWDDYDMICGAFYNGTLKLREVLCG